MILIKNTTVFTVTSGILSNTDVLVDEGKISKIAKNIKSPKAKIIDGEGYSLYPGFVDAHCHVGIMEGGIGPAGDDTNEMTSPNTAECRAIDGINPEDVSFSDAYKEGGVTSVMVAPGSANVIGGEACAVKTYGKTLDHMLIDPCIGMKMALGENPKRVYGSKGKNPSTRMAIAAYMRETFYKCQEYIEKRKKKDSKEPFNLQMENLSKVFKKKIPARIHCHRADDIATAIRVMNEFKLPFVLEHVTEGHKIPEVVKNAKVSACVGPTLTGKMKVELKDKTISTVKALYDAGVEVAIVTDHPVIDLYTLPICAGYALKTGLKEEEILKMITINPARICKIDKKVGSIEKGKDADLVLWKNNPLNTDGKVKTVLINGRIVYNNIEI